MPPLGSLLGSSVTTSTPQTSSSANHDCGATVLNSSEVILRAHQEKIQGLIGDVWPMSVRDVHQLSLSGPSLNNDDTQHSLGSRTQVVFFFFTFPGITCPVLTTFGVSPASGSFLNVFHLLLGLEPNPETLPSLVGILPPVWLIARGCPQNWASLCLEAGCIFQKHLAPLQPGTAMATPALGLFLLTPSLSSSHCSSEVDS